MLNYQTTSFHDALYARRILGLKPAPEFERWLDEMGITDRLRQPELADQLPVSFAGSLARLESGAALNG
jgi:ethanolamine ammonia-lyase large subunit